MALEVGSRLGHYDVTIASEVYARSGDALAVQRLLDHSTMSLTERYTRSVLHDRMVTALKGNQR